MLAEYPHKIHAEVFRAGRPAEQIAVLALAKRGRLPERGGLVRLTGGPGNPGRKAMAVYADMAWAVRAPRPAGRARALKDEAIALNRPQEPFPAQAKEAAIPRRGYLRLQQILKTLETEN